MQHDPELIAKRRAESDPCPCVYTRPCHRYCSCVTPASSKGCSRCCRYGSLEQRTKRAERIARATELEALERTML